MYTKATQKFGIWKNDHWLNKQAGPKPAYNLIIALSFLAFVSWLIFFITLKIRGEFYFLETSSLKIPTVSGDLQTGTYIQHRQPAAAVGVVKSGSESLSLIFNDGSVFRFPDETKEIEDYLASRFKRLELTAMLTKIPSKTISRVQFWVEEDVAFPRFHRILDLFTKLGFDEFDLALSVPSKALSARNAQVGHEQGRHPL